MMIETIVLDYLNETLPVKAYMEKPEEPPKEYVILEKASSGKENYILSATMAIQSVSPSLYLAATLNEEVKAAMEAITSLNEISKVTLNTDYNFTDATKKEHRYQAVFDLVHY